MNSLEDFNAFTKKYAAKPVTPNNDTDGLLDEDVTPATYTEDEGISGINPVESIRNEKDEFTAMVHEGSLNRLKVAVEENDTEKVVTILEQMDANLRDENGQYVGNMIMDNLRWNPSSFDVEYAKQLLTILGRLKPVKGKADAERLKKQTKGQTNILK